MLGLVYGTAADELAHSIQHETVESWKNSLSLTGWTKRGILRIIASQEELSCPADMPRAPLVAQNAWWKIRV